MNYKKLPTCIVMRKVEAWARTVPNAESFVVFMERGTVEIFFSPIQSKTYSINEILRKCG